MVHAWQDDDEEEEEDFYGELTDNYVLCALHQAKTIRERWKFWSGSVPANVSIRLHRLESLLSINDQRKSTTDIPLTPTTSVESPEKCKRKFESVKTSSLAVPCQELIQSNLAPIDLSQYFLSDMARCQSALQTLSLDEYVSTRIQPTQNIIIQGPDIRRMIHRPVIVQKRRARFWWCCH